MKLKNKIICFDLDNTLCTTESNFYNKSKPKKNNIKIVNELYDNGYYIKVFTARYMSRSKENPEKAKKRGYNQARKQLDSWNLKYHELIFGKPSFDLYIDDKSLFYLKSWSSKLKKLLLKDE